MLYSEVQRIHLCLFGAVGQGISDNITYSNHRCNEVLGTGFLIDQFLHEGTGGYLNIEFLFNVCFFKSNGGNEVRFFSFFSCLYLHKYLI